MVIEMSSPVSPCFLSLLECLGLVCCNSIPHGFVWEPHNIYNKICMGAERDLTRLIVVGILVICMGK